jgi:WD40 repeat protein
MPLATGIKLDGYEILGWSPDGRSIVAGSFDSSIMHLFDVKTQRWSMLYNGE